MGEWAFLIYLGLLLQVSGFLVREELLLRVLVAAGICCDLAFFALQTPPIWPSVMSNAVLVVVNIAILLVIIMERTTITLAPREKRLFAALGTLTPGQFRRLVKRARFHDASERTELMREGAQARSLFFVESGQFFLEKGGDVAAAQGPAFIGEIAFLRNCPASASVFINAETPYVEWPRETLDPLLARSQPLRNAVMTAVARDMAEKVARSLPVDRPTS